MDSSNLQYALLRTLARVAGAKQKRQVRKELFRGMLERQIFSSTIISKGK